MRHAGSADLETIRSLFKEYVTAPRGETLFQAYLDQQNFDRELSELPGEYGPPLGSLLLAEHGGIAIGCVAFKPLTPPEICEMKRLYVRPEGRGLGAGRALVEQVISAAQKAGYSAMRLDCLPTMHDAQRLYRACGFYEISAYNANPIPGSLFFERRI